MQAFILKCFKMFQKTYLTLFAKLISSAVLLEEENVFVTCKQRI